MTWMAWVRGDLYRLPARKDARNHKQHGPHCGVITQNDNLPLSTVLVSATAACCLAHVRTEGVIGVRTLEDMSSPS